MIKQSNTHEPMSTHDADILARMMEQCDRILIKKLSNNDRDWASNHNKHQAGVYIPHETRDGGFFPPLASKSRKDPTQADIREVYFTTAWPQLGLLSKQSRLVHYTSKGQETHLTGLPKELFAHLLPASFLVMGRVANSDESAWVCMTVDSASDEATLLADLFNLDPDVFIAEVSPDARRSEERSQLLEFVRRVTTAWLKGEIASFAVRNAVMPSPMELAAQARSNFLKKYGLATIDPFAMETPGDALREISRKIEWDIFREYQRRERSVELIRIVLGDAPITTNAADVISRLINSFHDIDALMLSAGQQRKSRAGYSYEHHIEAMLKGGRIPYEKQVVLASRKRPDFMLPSLAFIDGSSPKAGTGLILSAKTTLRERWKQVEREKANRQLYLTTVDENIPSTVIEDMASFGVHLVIPESLLEAKNAKKVTEYSGHANVLSFKQFCEDVVAPAMRHWS